GAIRFVAARCVHLALSIREVNPSWRNSAPTNRRLALPKTLGASKLEGKHCAPRPSIMKPGDHPDFFRLPPPPGRSRESRIVLDDLGRFWNGPVPIDHEAMSTAFASWIAIHPDDGRFILTNGYDWTYFTVKDAPFLVRHVESTPSGVLLRL